MHNCVSLWSSILLWNQKVDLPAFGKGERWGGGSPVIKVLVSERPLTVRAINLVWGCSVGTQVSVLSWLYNWLLLGLFIHNKCAKYLFTKRWHLMLLDTLVCCAPFTQFLLEKMSQYFFQTTPIYFFMLAFFHKKWFLIHALKLIIWSWKMIYMHHCLYRYKLLKHAVSKHFDVFSWLQTPYLTWLLLMKLYKYISESVYRQTGVCLGQM